MGLLSQFSENYDVPIDSSSDATNSPKPTGIDGVKHMLSHDSYGNPSPQLGMIKESTFISGLVGTLFGGLTYGQDAFRKFVRTNQATAFENPHMAQRLLHDRVMLAFGKGAWIWGWRLAFFSGSFVFISCAIPAYNGYHSFLDWVGGSTVAGMAYKFKHGPKPMVAGGVAGAIFGLGVGCIFSGILSLCGLTMDDIYDAKRRASTRALEAQHERLKKRREENPDSLLSPQ